MGKSLASAAWAGTLTAYVLEKSSKYIEYSCGFSAGALASALRRRTAIRSTYPFAAPNLRARAWIGAAASAVLVLVRLAPAAAQPVRLDGLAAIVGGTAPAPGVDVILQSDVELRARIRLNAAGAARVHALPSALLRAAMNEIIGEHLIAREARRVQAVSPSRADVERERRGLVRSAGGPQRLQSLLREFAVPATEIDAIARRRALVGAFLSANIEGATVVTEAELERAYEAGRESLAGRPRAEALTELRARLSRQALDRTIERWVTVLRARNEVRIHIDY